MSRWPSSSLKTSSIPCVIAGIRQCLGQNLRVLHFTGFITGRLDLCVCHTSIDGLRVIAEARQLSGQGFLFSVLPCLSLEDCLSVVDVPIGKLQIISGACHSGGATVAKVGPLRFKLTAFIIGVHLGEMPSCVSIDNLQPHGLVPDDVIAWTVQYPRQHCPSSVLPCLSPGILFNRVTV